MHVDNTYNLSFQRGRGSNRYTTLVIAFPPSMCIHQTCIRPIKTKQLLPIWGLASRCKSNAKFCNSLSNRNLSPQQLLCNVKTFPEKLSVWITSDTLRTAFEIWRKTLFPESESFMWIFVQHLFQILLVILMSTSQPVRWEHNTDSISKERNLFCL